MSSDSFETPWKPATSTIRPASSASWIRFARTSTIFALPWTVSVTMPACEPVSEIACVAEVDDRHRGERARDPLADRDQHVELARVGPRPTSRAPDRAARRSCRPSPRGRRRRGCPPRAPDEALRHRLQPLGARDRRPAELHHDGARRAERARRSRPPGSLDKRSRSSFHSACGSERPQAVLRDGGLRAAARLVRGGCALRRPRSRAGASR